MTNSITIATWNVNSIRARLNNVTDYLRDAAPDVVCLQELKCLEEQFPLMEIEDLGYNARLVGQKTYNGVAILSKHPIDEVVETTLPGDEAPEEARYIEALISAHGTVVRVASIYLPNGGAVDGPRFPRKLNFMERLRDHAQQLLSYDELVVLAGDYNVAPEDMDVYDAARLRDSLCFHPQEQMRFRALLNLGYTDAFRANNRDVPQFTWWDYRAGAWQKNHGLRIDHLLLSPKAADACTHVWVDEDPRGKEKASDHTPVCVSLQL